MIAAVRLICLLLGLLLGANGAVMLSDPGGWYSAVPGVIESGPLNTHFMRDIGAAYVLMGVALLLAAAKPAAGAPFVAGSALWLIAHAAIHLAELTVCGDPTTMFVRDFPGVHVPALLTATLAIFLNRWRRTHADMAHRA